MDDIISKKGEVVGSWNGESVEDLKKTLLKLRQELRAKGDKVEHTGIPHQDQFPDDLKEFTAYILWGCDKNNVCLVGSGANRTESVESIRKFPNQEKFSEMIINEGFRKVKYRDLTFGIAALHSAWKF